MANDYISKDATDTNVGDTVSRKLAVDTIVHEYAYAAAKIIEGLPSAQPERPKGEWIPMFNGKFKGGAYWFSCSKCKRIVPEVRNGGWNFCPNCGADMRGDNNDKSAEIH